MNRCAEILARKKGIPVCCCAPTPGETCPEHTPGDAAHSRALLEFLLALDALMLTIGRHEITNLSDVYRTVANSVDSPGGVPSDAEFDGKKTTEHAPAKELYAALRAADKADLWEVAARRVLRRGHFTGRGKGTP